MIIITTTHVIAVLLLVCCAAVSDILQHKIWNILTIPGVFIGGAINIYYYGWDGILFSASGLITPMILLGLFALQMLGAGDIKLFMAIGAILGWKLCICTMALSFLVGGVLALAVLVMRRNGIKRLRRLYHYVIITAGIRKFEPYDTMDASNDGYFSLGLCIAAGTVLTLFLYYHQLLQSIFFLRF